MKSLKFFLIIIIAFSSSCVLAQKKVRVEKPYIVHDKSSKVNRVDIRKDTKASDNVIQIDATNASGGAGMATKAMGMAAAEITSVNIISGNYNQTREVSKTSRGMSLQLLDVVFPCRIRVNVSDQFLDVEIKEAGFWKIAVALIN